MAHDMRFYDITSFTAAVRTNNSGAVAQAAVTPPTPITGKETAYAVRLDWLLTSAIRLLSTGEEYMHFVVENRGVKADVGQFILASQYKLYAEGVDDESKFVVAEDFPPHIWP